MTAHLPLFGAPRNPAPTGDGLAALTGHRPSTTGASIVALHVHDGGCTCPACSAARRHELALERLAAYLEDEGPGLRRVLRLLDLRGGEADLAALEGLHATPGREVEALADAARHLERIHEDLAETPVRATCVGLVPAAERSTARDLDAAIRWYGARSADILALLRNSIG